MAKEIILYNLAEHVTEAQYQKYVKEEKGPLLESLPGVSKFELLRVTTSPRGEIPYRYVGILHIGNLEKFLREAAPSEKFQSFVAKWSTMVRPGFHTLIGEEIY